MDLFYQIIFYIFALLILSGALFALFAKKTIYSILGATISFWGVAGLYLLLGLSYLAAAQLLVYGVGVVILLVFCIMLTNKIQDEKTWFNFDFKTVVAFILLVAMGLMFLPFVQNALTSRDVFFNYSLVSFAQELYQSSFLPFELVSVLLLVSLIGTVAIVYRRGK